MICDICGHNASSSKTVLGLYYCSRCNRYGYVPLAAEDIYESIDIPMLLKALTDINPMADLFTLSTLGLIGDICKTEQRLLYIISEILLSEFPLKRLIYESNSDSELEFVVEQLCQRFFVSEATCDYIVKAFAYAIGKCKTYIAIDAIVNLNVSVSGFISIVEQSIAEEEFTQNGEPVFVKVDEGEFCGYRNQENERCGFGILKEPKGSYYAGEWNLDMRMGVGLGFSTTRRKYAGQWRINKQHGIGIELQDDGTIYSGQWKDGKRNGYGTLFFPNGESLSCMFVNDEIAETTGIWNLQDKSFVQGKMTPNGPMGLCFHTLPDGTIIEEYWNNGKLIKE